MKKTRGLFAEFTISDIASKVLSSKKIQPVLNRTFEQMIKLKSRLDSIMPMALGVFNMPSVKDIKKLKDEVSKLNIKLEELSLKLAKAKKPRKKRKKTVKRTPAQPARQETNEAAQPLPDQGPDNPTE